MDNQDDLDWDDVLTRAENKARDFRLSVHNISPSFGVEAEEARFYAKDAARVWEKVAAALSELQKFHKERG